MRKCAFREAVTHYRRAIETSAVAGEPEEMILRLQVGLTEAAANAGDFNIVREESHATMDRARRLNDGLAFARAAYCFSLESETDLPNASVTQAIEEALDRYGEEDLLKVRLLTRLASAQWFAAPPDVARDLAIRGVEMGRRVGDPDSLGLALTRGYRICQGPADLIELRTAFAQELLELMPRIRGPAERLECRWHLAADAMERGDRVAYDQRVDALLREAVESSHPFAPWYAASFRTARLHLDGRFREAEAEARRGLHLAGPSAIQFSVHVFELQMFAICVSSGRFDDQLDEYRRHATADKPPAWRIYLALVEALQGIRPDAEEVLDAFIANDLAAVARDANWMITLIPLAELCVQLGRRDLAPILLHHLSPFEHRHALFAAAWCHNGSIARRLGMLNELLGRHDEALRQVRLGIELDMRLGAPAFVARGRVACAKLLLRQRSRNARKEARALLESALESAESLELDEVRAEAAALLS